MKSYRVTYLKSASYQVCADDEDEARYIGAEMLMDDEMAWQDEPYDIEVEDITKEQP